MDDPAGKERCGEMKHQPPMKHRANVNIKPHRREETQCGKAATEVAQVSSPMSLGFEGPVLRPCPVGTCENSPAFQRWVWVSLRMRPVGTPEKQLIRPSLRDLDMFGCDPSVETLGYFHSSLRDQEPQILVALGFQPALRGLTRPTERKIYEFFTTA